MTTPFSASKLSSLCSELVTMGYKVEQLDSEIKRELNLTLREAYCVIRNDALWKVQRKVGELHFYLCGTVELNPFEGDIPLAN